MKDAKMEKLIIAKLHWNVWVSCALQLKKVEQNLSHRDHIYILHLHVLSAYVDTNDETFSSSPSRVMSITPK
jgi:hypothetical protein